MNKKEKLLAIILTFMMIIVVIILIIYNINRNPNDDYNLNNDSNKEENKIVENLNNEVVSDKEISNILFSNIKYIFNGNETILSMKIINNNDKIINLNHFIINAYDEDKNLIGTFNSICNTKIKSTDFIEFEVLVHTDLSKAYSIEIELPELEFIE